MVSALALIIRLPMDRSFAQKGISLPLHHARLVALPCGVDYREYFLCRRDVVAGF